MNLYQPECLLNGIYVAFILCFQEAKDFQAKQDFQISQTLLGPQHLGSTPPLDHHHPLSLISLNRLDTFEHVYVFRPQSEAGR